MGLTLEQLYNAAYAWHLEAPRSGGDMSASWHVNYLVAERTYCVQMVLAYTKYSEAGPSFDSLRTTLTYTQIQQLMGRNYTVQNVLNAALQELFKEAQVEPPESLTTTS